MQLVMLLIFLISLASCVTKSEPIVLIRCEDFGDGLNKCEPSDRTKWMWITYPKAKQQLHWINNK